MRGSNRDALNRAQGGGFQTSAKGWLSGIRPPRKARWSVMLFLHPLQELKQSVVWHLHRANFP